MTANNGTAEEPAIIGQAFDRRSAADGASDRFLNRPDSVGEQADRVCTDARTDIGPASTVARLDEEETAVLRPVGMRRVER
jgi:hypothetical protein